ncbi:unnamed protein product [Ceutorhynchus assimilis]|uniref:Uncharacterized protein n=1 Tax=Ceutorhynchus assimilis TaxID=467358 RepID=A0A9N9QSP0_9CUCU|nr:unnamed protein product [Ceutorhynchus assimilis]
MSEDDELPNTLTPPTQNSSHSQQDNVNLVNEIPWGRLITCIKCLHSIDLIQSVTFGRGSACDVIVPAKDCPPGLLPNISKKHFTIERNLKDNLVYVTDFSKNGTYINGEIIGTNKKKILIDKDEIAVSTPHQIIYKFLSHGNEKPDFLPSDLLSKYANVRRLGRGSCGEVMLVKDRSTLKEYAIKKIILCDNNSSQMYKINHPSKVDNEVTILGNLDHPLIIGMLDIHSVDKEVYLILEYMAGGELTSRIHRSPMSLDTAKFYFVQILLATNYLHSLNVIHRDLKPENILLLDEREETLLKITDFGLSKFAEGSVMTKCGTYRFAAPEVINPKQRKYSKEADIWSLGVILYFMISQDFPFQGKNESELTKNILKGNYGFHRPIWQDEDMVPVKDLLTKILVLNPKNRFGISQIVDHDWIKYDHGVKHRVSQLLEQQGLENPMAAFSLEPEPKKFRFSNSQIVRSHSSSDDSDHDHTLTNSSELSCTPTLCFLEQVQ